LPIELPTIFAQVHPAGSARGDVEDMRLAVLTDIHANREALTAVLADAAQRGCDQIAVLGDVVGYGPDPGWCVDRIAALQAAGAVCVMGNHDRAIAMGGESMSTNAQKAIDWTRGQLTPQQVAVLAALPMTATAGDALLVHASADSPANWSYVTSDLMAVGSFQATQARLIFVGHVHVPMLVSCGLSGQVREQRFKTGMAVPLIRSRRWLAVVGSVGQPRDRNPAASYAIHDSGANEITFRKVPYDCAATALKVRAAGLPEALALRLLTGD
jgi:diadenosine tetraphosphatase ApaH/serine/threonine PP2A family protein phosphatase